MFKGDGYVPVRHCEDVDHSVQVLRFAREAADDILLVNFAAHATFTESKLCPDVSSDFPGAMVDCVEALFPGTKCAYLQGCCGNVVGSTIIESEGLWQITVPQEGRNYHAYGAALAGAVQRILLHNMHDSASDTLAFIHRVHMGACDHSRDEFAPKAKQALKVFEQEGHTPAAKEWCRRFGLGNVYACSAILRKAALPEKSEIELNAVRIGDCALTTIPFEPYSSVGEEVKAGSQYPVTFVCGYCCGQNGYLPNKKVHPDSYEGRVTSFRLGTAEEVAGVLGEMLKELH